MIAISDYDQQAILASAQSPVWVTEAGELARLCEHWQQCELLALDTEFIRTKTYYAIPGLIQLADNQACYLIDPLSIDDWSAFADLMENPAVLKVLHAPTEDIELFRYRYKVIPTPVIDTQICAALLGWGNSMGLQRILRETLGVELAKDETTSEWLNRPLTPEQEIYAALDVAYLVQLFVILKQRLTELGRYEWALQETDRLVNSIVHADDDIPNYYLRFSQFWNLRAERQAALRDLIIWREHKCRQLDIPRNRVLSNHQVNDIIKRWPRSIPELMKIKSVRAHTAKDFGSEIMACLDQSDRSEQDAPLELIPRPLDLPWHQPVKKLRARAHEIAASLGIPEDYLVRKRDVEALIRNFDQPGEFQMPAQLQGWRRELVGEPLLAYLKELVESRKK